ncbi:butyrophilin subfamily 1 member A1-like isoform X2 [Colossoma macropomum]|nr:butyrophilin subfamily 1 member A1-like isoform X2 [Colossoma macropomum]
MLMFLIIVLLWPQLTQGSDSLPVKVANTAVIGRLGSSVVLPCWLNPSLDVRTMEIRWYRPHKFNIPVLFYREQKIMTDPQEESYRNRSSLALREPQSDGLKGGDLSLRLDNLNIDDEGTFHCYVSGDKGYGSADVTLSITAQGSSPVLLVQPKDDLMNVSCSSCGWHPQPRVEWKSNRTTSFRPVALVYSQGENKLTCVQSWALLSPSDFHQVSCSLFISEGDERESTVAIQTISRLMDSAEDGAASWKALFAVALLVALAMIGVSVFLYRKYKSGYMRAKADEEQLTVCSNPNMEDLRKHAVSITLDSTNICPDLVIIPNRNMVRDRASAADNHKGPGFPYYLSVCGIKGLSSGCAYWEVKLTAAQIKPKQSWLIGVTKAAHYLSNDKSDLTPSKGFWFLCSDEQTGLHINTEPEISLPVNSRLEVVGVLLHYEKGELSFYNAKEGVHLFTMKTKFQGEIVPLFNPGIGDEAPLTIINLPESSTQRNGASESAESASPQANVA